MARSIIHRTGLNTGRVYNYAGDNLTAYPPGAGNSMVGPWAMDFIAMFGGTEPEAGIMWDSEFSGIIMDGRGLAQGTLEQPMLFADLDEDEDLTDRRSIVGEGAQRYAKCSSTWTRLYHTAPRWEDARVWDIDIDGTHGTEPAMRLDEYLDLQYQMTGDGLWHSMRHTLRVPVRWAIMKCPMMQGYEQMLDMVAENTVLAITNGDLMNYGPRGMLTALHGTVWAAQHATRLYEPSEALGIVERGMFFMPYDGTVRDDDMTTPRAGVAPVTGQFNMSTNVDQPIMNGDLSVALTGTSGGNIFHELEVNLAADGSVTGSNTIPNEFSGSVLAVPSGNSIDLEFSQPGMTGDHNLSASGAATPSAASRNWGTIYSTVISTKKNVTVGARKPFIYVWVFQTCPVRLETRRDPGNDDLLGHVVIGGLTSPFIGPPVRLVYHEGNATYSVR